MKLNQATVKLIVIESLRVVGNGDANAAIGNDTRPIGDLGLVSADGVDLALELEDRLNCKIDDRANPLVSDDGRRPRRVEEIVEWIMTSHSLRHEETANA